MCTIAGGPFSRWYWEKNDHGSWRAFSDAVKYSLGSVALGSPVIGIAETLQSLIKPSSGNQMPNGEVMLPDGKLISLTGTQNPAQSLIVSKIESMNDEVHLIQDSAPYLQPL